MPSKKLKEFLDSHGIKFVSTGHSPTYTAQEIAAAANIPRKCLAKTVIVKIADKLAMAVLPADCRVNFDLLKDVTGQTKLNSPSSWGSRIRFRIVMWAPCLRSETCTDWKCMRQNPWLKMKKSCSMRAPTRRSSS